VDVAEAAEQTVYNYFPTKKDLVFDLEVYSRLSLADAQEGYDQATRRFPVWLKSR
jgi:hypothetical protein